MLREGTHNLIPKPDIMITDLHIYLDGITREVGFCTASALAGIHIYESVMLLIASQKHNNDFEQVSLQIISDNFLVKSGIRTQHLWQTAPTRLAYTLSHWHTNNATGWNTQSHSRAWSHDRRPAYILRCYHQRSRVLHSLRTRRYTYLWSCDAIYSFTEALQRFWAIVFTNHSWNFCGLEWDSNPGPLADGTNSPCIYAKPLTYHSRCRKRDKISFPSLISWSLTRIYTQMLLPEQ